MRGERRASDLKELQVHIDANLSNRAGHIFQTFGKNCSEYKESVDKNSISVEIHNQTCDFLAVEFPEVLENFIENPWPE